MPDPDNFRTNTLTVLGAVGFVVFFALAVARGLGHPVSWELLGTVFSASSGLLSLEFGLDTFPVQVSWRNDPGQDRDD